MSGQDMSTCVALQAKSLPCKPAVEVFGIAYARGSANRPWELNYLPLALGFGFHVAV